MREITSMIEIPGVQLNVYRQGIRLDVAPQGGLGELCSGSVVLEATIPNGDRFFGMLRHGNDSYILQKDWANLPERPRKPWQEEVKRIVEARNLPPETKVFGVKMPVAVSEDGQESFVSYPNNMLCLAELVRRDDALTNLVNLWNIAIISQAGHFFLTVQRTKNEIPCVRADDGELRFPRLNKHESLNKVLVGLMPSDAPIPSSADYVEPDEDLLPELDENEGIVETFYQARGIGTLLACHRGEIVKARIGWRDAPKRPLRKFLVEGERVKFDRLDVPFETGRETSFAKQAYGISLA